MASGFDGNAAHSFGGIHTVGNTLVDNIQRQLTLVGLSFVFLLDVLDKFLTLWSATLLKTWIDGVLIGIH